MTIDMQTFAKILERALMEYLELDEKPAFCLCYTLPNDKECHWVTNVSKEDGTNLFLSTGLKMQNRNNL
jgi:hypothetical protein